MALSAGDQLGQYTVQGPIGHGGMASVYRAYHARLSRYVAIKVIHADGDPSFLARFEREAVIVAALDHPNIVPVFDFADHDGQPYLVMKLIDGATLRRVLSEGTLEIDGVIALITPLAAALDYAHHQGVLHRDIKPTNILLDKNAVPYISDFGLARMTMAGESSMSAGMVLGTPHYISPEQVLGKPIDHRADLYSFGVILYEMLVGQLPFNTGTPYNILQDHVTRELPLPSSINPNIPPAVEIVLLRALAKDPDSRYDSARQITDELTHALTANAGDTQALRGESRQALDASLSKAWIIFDNAAPVLSSAQRAVAPTQIAPPSPATQMAPQDRRVWIWSAIALAAVSSMIVAALLFTALRNDPPAIIPRAQNQGQSDGEGQLFLIERLPVDAVPLNEAETRLAQAPSDPTAHLAVARALLLRDRLADAETAIRAGLEYAPSPAAYLITAGDLMRQSGHFAEAFPIYFQALRVTDPTLTPSQVRGEIHLILYTMSGETRGLSQEQIDRLQRFTEIEQTPPVALAILARVLMVNDDLTGADAALQRALERDSRMPDIRLVAGELYAAQGNLEQARAEWQRILNGGPAPEWLLQRAQTLLAG